MTFEGVFQVQFCSGIIWCKENKKYMLRLNVLSVVAMFVKLNFFSRCCFYVQNFISLVLKCPIMLFLFISNVCVLDVFLVFMFLWSNDNVTILFLSLAVVIIVVFCVDPFTLFMSFINENIVYIYKIIVGLSCSRFLYQYSWDLYY